VGVWPLAPVDGKGLRALADRMAAYMEKATHEAKVHTSWINPDAEYDAAVRDFVAAVLDDLPRNRFLAEFRRFHEQVVNWGLYGALSQTLLKLTVPGVPDIYQGQELWDFSLVDPDNRRPVDFVQRRKMLARLGKDIGRNERSLLSVARQLARDPCDPRLKLFVTWRALQFRRQHADLFRMGDYIPLEVDGQQARHVCAFAREYASTSAGARKVAVVIAPCLIAQLTPANADSPATPPPIGPVVWGDTFVSVGDGTARTLKNLFTGQVSSPANCCLPVATALADFPVALLGDF
jgi:(1->4)-alpha-D-glucan 1-alpha-D-glucosylmutase